MLKSILLTIISVLVYYSILLSLYLFDVIWSFVFLVFLLYGIIIVGVLFLVFFKNTSLKRSFGASIVLLSILFAYEFLLLFDISAPAYSVKNYIPPHESIAGSGIYSVGIGEIEYDKKDSKELIHTVLTEQGVDVLSITKIDNMMIYGVKNRQLLSWLHLRKEYSSKEMVETVQDYLVNEMDWVLNWDKEGISGHSAGLSLALSGLYNRGDFENHIPIAVTGGINKDGKVTKVGGIKEKLQIIEKAEISIALLPTKNKREAEKLRKEMKSKVSIFYVSDVKEAQRKIEELNLKHKAAQ
ncbi:S16 family serine protease [Sporosarcina sp. OR05]|uniref:S16 family serine protease n=1 Tax=Sporosarcina sp. OR05 TaxID=2969819 RepID=UPI00352AC069